MPSTFTGQIAKNDRSTHVRNLLDPKQREVCVICGKKEKAIGAISCSDPACTTKCPDPDCQGDHTKRPRYPECYHCKRVFLAGQDRKHGYAGSPDVYVYVMDKRRYGQPIGFTMNLTERLEEKVCSRYLNLVARYPDVYQAFEAEWTLKRMKTSKSTELLEVYGRITATTLSHSVAATAAVIDDGGTLQVRIKLSMERPPGGLSHGHLSPIDHYRVLRPGSPWEILGKRDSDFELCAPADEAIGEWQFQAATKHAVGPITRLIVPSDILV